MIFQLIGNPHVVLIEPLVTNFDCLFWVHANKITYILVDQFFHFFVADAGRHTSDVKKVRIAVVIFIVGCVSYLLALN